MISRPKICARKEIRSPGKTVEAYILELLDAKINMFQLVVGELDMILGNLKEKRSFEDIVMDVWSRAAARISSRFSKGLTNCRKAMGRYPPPENSGERWEVRGIKSRC